MPSTKKAERLLPNDRLAGTSGSTDEWQEEADSAATLAEQSAEHFEQLAGDEVDWYPRGPTDKRDE